MILELHVAGDNFVDYLKHGILKMIGTNMIVFVQIIY